MSWTMSTLKAERGEYHVYIGAVKVAEVCFSKGATRWKVFLRLMRNHVAYDVREHYETMSDALRDLHRLLNAPPPEGARVGVARRQNEAREALAEESR